MRYLPRWANENVSLIPAEYRYFPDRESSIILMAKHGLDDILHSFEWETSTPAKEVAIALPTIIMELFGDLDHISKDGSFPWFKILYTTVRSRIGMEVRPFQWTFISDHVFVKVSETRGSNNVKASITGVVDGTLNFAKFVTKIKHAFPLIQPPAAKQTYVLIQDQDGFRLQGITNEAQTSFVADNYADDVVADFAYIRDELNSDSCHGSIVIFDGPPGSGKTHLVRYLINSSTRSKYILIPPEMVSSLTSPNLVAFLIQQATANKGRPMVFVLEDGDQALVPRDAGNVGVIQSLLNLTDGILGRALNIRILCTTNADSTAVDPAILRSGRLIRRTHVGFLPKKKAEAVMQRLGAEGKLPEPKVKPKAVGFGSATEEPRYLLADLYALANQFRVADPSPEPESVAGYEEEEEEVEYGREYEIGL